MPGTMEASLPEGTASDPEDHHPTSPGNAHGPQYDFIGGFRETLRPEWPMQTLPVQSLTNCAPLGIGLSSGCGPSPLPHHEP